MWSEQASAGTVTAQGAVTALTKASQMRNPASGDFDDCAVNQSISASVYAAKGMTWRSGPVSSFLPGVTQTGSAILPSAVNWFDTAFPAPRNGGAHSGLALLQSSVVTFSVPVTQVGLTASSNGDQFLTAWDSAGQMIGQVTWHPTADSSFVGLDSNGVRIAMFSFGNDDLWKGENFDQVGATTASDNWQWGGICTADAQCDDGNVCTTDTCNGSGDCVHTATAGNTCNDGDACTQTDTCQAGVCTGSDPVTCAADECHRAGTCNPATGTCSPATQKSDGETCSDGNACTESDTCQAGVCISGDPVVCAPAETCKLAGVCSPLTGTCSYDDEKNGTACTLTNLCDATPTCQAGTCTGTPVVCPPIDQCHAAGTCDPGTGTCSQPAAAEGAACNDGNACTQADTCSDGTCSPGKAVVCTPLDACHDVGVCNTTDGKCSNPPKPDGTACPGGMCAAGTCKVTSTADAGVNPVEDPSTDAGADTGTDTVGAEGGGGCGCTTAPGDSSRLGLAGLGLVGLLVMRRRRDAR